MEQAQAGIIYVLTCRPTSMSYVGQTWNTLEERYGGFKSPPRSRGRSVLRDAVKRHGWPAFERQVIETHQTQADLDDAEEFWIAYLGTRWPNGYNLRSGGSRGLHSEESKQLMSDVHRKPLEQIDMTTGDVMATFESLAAAEETTGIRSSNISKCCSGQLPHAGGFIWRHQDCEHTGRGKWSGAARERMRLRVSQEGRLNKAVLQIDLKTGDVVAEHPSMKAAEETAGVTKQNISHVCRGTRRSAGGFGWRYKDAADADRHRWSDAAVESLRRRRSA